MSPQAVSNKIRHDKEKAAARLQPAFPAAVEEDSDVSVGSAINPR